VVLIGSYLLCLVVLTKPSRCAFGQLLELSNSVIVTAKETCDSRLGICSDRPTPVDAVKATYLLFISFQTFFK